MPITSVYEDGLVLCTDDNVGSTWQLIDVRLEIMAQRRQTTLHRSFGGSVSPSYGGHSSTGLRRCIHGPFDPLARRRSYSIALCAEPMVIGRRIAWPSKLGNLRAAAFLADQMEDNAASLIRWKIMRQVPSRNPIVAEPHLRSNAPVSGAARHPPCARRIENHLGTLEDEPPREASTLWRELDA